MSENKILDTMWDDNPIDITQEANFIWSIANKLRGSYMPDKYGDVVIPMTILRRFECALQATKQAVLKAYQSNPNYPPKALCKIAGFSFYNTSEYDLKELCNDSKHIAANFKNYISGFSANVKDIFAELEMDKHIDKMEKDGCLYSVVEAFSVLDLSIKTYDSIKMGYIFENLIGRFYQNVDAGQFYTGRDIIKLLVEILMAEGCDDIFDSHKVITVLDQACGTGGMLSTAYTYIKHYNPTAEVKLFGQEFMGQSYAVGLAEMLIKNQDSDNFRHVDTFKTDCFADTKMRFVIENPPFGTPWSGKDAKDGQEQAVRDEYAKGETGRWGHGLPSGGDSQMIFLQSAVDKMDDFCGRAAIIENGSPLFNGDTASGESQIRRWLLESDLIEAIIALPTDLFYNTGIQTYVWILSKNKRQERKGKIQLINAAEIYHKLRKAVGNKKNEITREDRKKITHLYADFVPSDLCKIYDNTEFLYKEYAVMQPLQRSYAITEERIEQMLMKGALSGCVLNQISPTIDTATTAMPMPDSAPRKSIATSCQVAYRPLVKTGSWNISEMPAMTNAESKERGSDTHLGLISRKNVPNNPNPSTRKSEKCPSPFRISVWKVSKTDTVIVFSTVRSGRPTYVARTVTLPDLSDVNTPFSSIEPSPLTTSHFTFFVTLPPVYAVRSILPPLTHLSGATTVSPSTTSGTVTCSVAVIVLS